VTSKLDRTFAQLQQNGEKALIAYVMAGDPSLPITEQLVVELEQAGADIIELGVPFSDPHRRWPRDPTGGRTSLAQRDIASSDPVHGHKPQEENPGSIGPDGLLQQYSRIRSRTVLS
jgi:hypothetical protein